jgi:hypothetical protein
MIVKMKNMDDPLESDAVDKTVGDMTIKKS